MGRGRTEGVYCELYVYSVKCTVYCLDTRWTLKVSSWNEGGLRAFTVYYIQCKVYSILPRWNLKVSSWNVDGLRACAKKGGGEFINQEQNQSTNK